MTGKPTIWPRLEPAEIRMLLRVRQAGADCCVERDPVSGLFFCTYDGAHTTSDNHTAIDALAEAAAAVQWQHARKEATR